MFMPDKARLWQIRNAAQELRLAAGVVGQTMLPLNTIADFLQFRITLFQPQENNKEISGAIDYPQRIIHINSLDNVGRQRFTISHEFGHMLVHSEYQDEPGWVYDFRLPDVNHKKSIREQEADLFAAELLMPIELLREQLDINAGNLQAVANAFQVSMEALRYRLDFLNLELWSIKTTILEKFKPGQRPNDGII
jgi:Zn-dependent peptidase ImmA (M78 family)